MLFLPASSDQIKRKEISNINQHKQIKTTAAAAASIGLCMPLASHAINPAYAEKLEKSGCTQVTELKAVTSTRPR